MASAGTGVWAFLFLRLRVVNGGPCYGGAHSPGGSGDGHGLSQPWDLRSRCVKLPTSGTLAALPQRCGHGFSHAPLPSAVHTLLNTATGLQDPRPTGNRPGVVKGLVRRHSASWWQRRNPSHSLPVPICLMESQDPDGGVSDKTELEEGIHGPRPLPPEDRAGGEWGGGRAAALRAERTSRGGGRPRLVIVSVAFLTSPPGPASGLYSLLCGESLIKCQRLAQLGLLLRIRSTNIPQIHNNNNAHLAVTVCQTPVGQLTRPSQQRSPPCHK